MSLRASIEDKYIEMNEEDFFSTVDKFRSPHLWRKKNKEWKLLHQVY